jgi:hypothetical protein
MTVLRITVPDQYFCTKHPDLNITAQEKKSRAGTGVPAYREIFTSAREYIEERCMYSTPSAKPV